MTNDSLGNLVNKNREIERSYNMDKGMFIFNKDDIERALEREFRSTRKGVLEEIYEEESFKYFATIKPELFKSLDNLVHMFTNFSEVVELCKTRLTLYSLVSPKLIYLPPILLTGEPGVGKTRFLKELAKILDTDFYMLDFSTISSGFILNGGDSSWSDSKPGFISDSLRQSQYANPIILLDEIDKVNADMRYDPMACLYSLLEPHSASNFRDEFLEIPLDTSKIIWFATANYPERIAAPIRSRMTEIHINLPTFEQSKNIVKSIYNEILNSHRWGNHFSTKLSRKMIERLATLTPREVRKELEKALANAAIRSRNESRQIALLATDLGELSDVKRQSKGIGFLAEI